MNTRHSALGRTDGVVRSRGVALLFVLAAIVVVSTAALSLARVVSSERVRVRMDQDAESASEIARAVESPILTWLVDHSRKVVLPASATEPRVEVLHDRFDVGDRPVEIRVTAFDELGKLPITVLKSGGPLLRALPPRVLAMRPFVLERLERARGPLGLDLFVDAEGRGGSPFPLEFPEPEARENFGAAALDAAIVPEPIALGACLSTLQAPPGRINVQTAPLSVIASIFEAAHLSGFDAIEKRRERGERVLSVPTAKALRAGARALPVFVSESTSWAFRIDVRVGAVRRSWWTVYEAASTAEWIASQRMAIP